MPVEEVEILGLKELDQRLKKLPPEIEKKALRSALMFASNPMWKDARERSKASYASGNMHDQIRRRGRKTFKGFRVQIYVRTGKHLGELDAYYWRFQHFVSKKNKGAKGGSGGRPNPFLTDAFDFGVVDAANRSKDGLRKAIDKEAKKLGRRGRRI